MMPSMLSGILALLLVQTGPPAAPSAPPLTVKAVRAERAPSIDGRLDDPAWAAATPVTGLLQTVPDEARPVSESTEVRIIYDADAVYVGARLFDREPAKILRRLARRDAPTHSDEFRVLLDSYHDLRTAFEFAVSASNVHTDVIYGGDGNFKDDSWDPVWESATTVDSLGWTAEIRIPLSQLRFTKSQDQVWGVRFVRWIERKNELAMYPFVARTESGMASRFAPLVGLSDLQSPKHLQVLPYVVGSGTYEQPTQLGNPFESSSDYRQNVGGDIKYGVTSSLTLDATVNPDFGQVEVDQTFVNLTEFEQFLEEHRPFFVEGTQIFDFGGTGGGVTKFGDPPLFFYSRRIGRPPEGEPSHNGQFKDIPQSTTILGAAKLSGRSAGGWSVGLLDALTARERATVLDTTTGTRYRDEVEPATNYLVGRLKRDLNGGNTSIGLLATAIDRRPTTAALDILPRDAFSGGLDFFHKWHNNRYTLAGTLGGSYLRGEPAALQQVQRSSNRYYQRPDAQSFGYDSARTSLAGVSADLYLNKVAGNWRWGLAGFTTSPGFEVNDLGFQNRVDRISAEWALGYKWTKSRRFFRQANAYLKVAPTWNYDGDPIDRTIGAFGYVQLRNFWTGDWSISYDPQVVDDRLTRGGPLAMKPAGWYATTDLQSDTRRAVGFYGFASLQHDVAGGWALNLIPQVSLRPSAALSLSATGGYFAGRSAAQFVTRGPVDSTATATLGRRYVFAELSQREAYVTLRANATFSPTLSLQFYAQPFTFAGDYEGFKELQARKTFAFNVYGRDNGSTINRTGNTYVVQPDGAVPGDTLRFTNPDFRTRSVKLNAVLRWEYRPGSTLFVVWTQSRSGYAPYDPEFDVGRDFGGQLFRDRPTNILLVKFNYWLSL
jgi:hypothetical protein